LKFEGNQGKDSGLTFSSSAHVLESAQRMIRAFIAFDLSESLRRVIREQVERIEQGLPKNSIRWVKVEGIHLTLRFLGNIAQGKINQVQQAMEHAASNVKAFMFQVSGLGCFPNNRRPRVLWIGVQEPTGSLLKVQSVLEQELEGLGFEKETRPFHPHLTIGRVKRHVRGEELKIISRAMQEIQIGMMGQEEVHQVLLIRSDLRPSGAVYTHLAHAPLESGD
jgi:2'-5' RNA ligase